MCDVCLRRGVCTCSTCLFVRGHLEGEESGGGGGGRGEEGGYLLLGNGRQRIVGRVGS